ncbi:hypothetical protein BPAE_0361g00040 [Botrytis paeoniae]|uniref:DUF676 domain-containing protein n=1 Tax=Botrytis paeoniae TaxID=278948 RepID=A0A4Z1F658_9HELO|nr:hypothetical protein BPAE_0361g00040 [Botrytis paeoniae]
MNSAKSYSDPPFTNVWQPQKHCTSSHGINYIDQALKGVSFGNSSKGSREAATDLKGPLGLNLLHAPLEPLIDFIFVHGLGGGSRKTWSKSEDAYHYWPKEWLSRDPDFKNVRIFSFGYSADWTVRSGDALDISDFAQSLLGELNTCPEIRRSKTKIVFVGHSMEDPAMQDLVRRVDTMYFLATPHRGSNLAATLNNILRISFGTKQFTIDLEMNSKMIASINQSFRHYSENLHIWSFYETQQTSFINARIVEKESATLEWPKERIAYINADHRGICKFDLPSDPNFKTLKNALSSTVDHATAEILRIQCETTSAERHCLHGLLGIHDVPEDDLIAARDAKIEGSCKWLIMTPKFTSWQDPTSDTPPVFWLSGNPASGKSVLAGHVIDHLCQSNLACSYFFFKDEVAAISSVGYFLRTFAYQMALNSPEIRRFLLDMESNGTTINNNDEIVIWNKLFVNGILQLTMNVHQYWVLDALDECACSQALLPMLIKLVNSPRSRLRIFITSRHSQALDKGFLSFGKNLISQEICISDTMGDIKLFLEAHMDTLPLDTPHKQEELTERILGMSSGSFLWVRLVMQELSEIYSEEEIETVLSDIPADMNQFYTKILRNLSNDRRGAKLAKVIFTWIVCSYRPLTITEMQCALKLDSKSTVNSLRRDISSICGQLVFVDQQSRIHLIHQSAKDFLLQEDLCSNFFVDRREGHYRLASLFLDVLSKGYLRAFRVKRFEISTSSASHEAMLLDYAYTFFSEHLYQSLSSCAELFRKLYKFLDTNVLWWIETVARIGNVNDISRAAKNMKAYLVRREMHFPPIDENLREVESWITDLVRISTKFRNVLLASPSSIHGKIPSMCPSQSIVATKQKQLKNSLKVVGLSRGTWDDCLAQIDYKGQGLQAITLTHGEHTFAVGLSGGQIIVYDSATTQVKCTFDHGEKVKLLAFGTKDKFLASAGMRSIRIWNLETGSMRCSFQLGYRTVALEFTPENHGLVVATSENFVSWLDISKEEEKDRVFWHETNHDRREIIQQPPIEVVIAPDLEMIAVSSRASPILLFDLFNEVMCGELVRDRELMESVGGTYYHASAMAFNPSLEINLLVVSYGDGELVVFDPRTTELKHRIPEVHAQTLACSPNGRTLATGSPFGTIRLFEFDGTEDANLSLIYRINAYDEGVRSLVFSGDGLRFIDIRGSHCRVWEPAALVRKPFSDGNNIDISAPERALVQTMGMIEGILKPDITAIAVDSNGGWVFCGRQDGSVAVYNTHDGLENTCLYQHATDISITRIVWGDNTSILTTADESGRMLIQRLMNSSDIWSLSETIFDYRFPDAVTGLLFNPGNNILLITTASYMYIWTSESGDIHHRVPTGHNLQNYRINTHTKMPDAFIAFYPNCARIFEWGSLKELSGPGGTSLDVPGLVSYPVTTTESVESQYTMVTLTKSRLGQTPSQLRCWDTSTIDRHSIAIKAFPGLGSLGPYIYHIIGLSGTNLFFLATDLWVCSLNMDNFWLSPDVKRYFFIPADWINPTDEMQFYLTAKDEFIFVKKNELAIIKRGLDLPQIIKPLQFLPEKRFFGACYTGD